MKLLYLLGFTLFSFLQIIAILAFTELLVGSHNTRDQWLWFATIGFVMFWLSIVTVCPLSEELWKIHTAGIGAKMVFSIALFWFGMSFVQAGFQFAFGKTMSSDIMFFPIVLGLLANQISCTKRIKEKIWS
jgi:hypothetical protein